MPDWRIKVCIQNVLARLPFSENLNHSLQLLRSKLGIANIGRIAGLRLKIPTVCKGLRRLARYVPLEGAEVVEVGTGWAPLPTILLYLSGTRLIHTYDVARHARFSLTSELLAVLREQIDVCAEVLELPKEVISDRLVRIERATSIEEIFSLAGIEYYAPGDATATGLPDRSVDIYYSYSVLESMPVQVVDDVCREARRILKPAGRFFAFIGCMDDYSAFDKNLPTLHYLKYTDAQWKRIAMNKIVYLNRLREEEYLEMFRQYGASIDHIEHALAPEDIEQVKNMKLSDRFSHFTPEQNAVLRTEIILSFP